jgi:hypothetical protein
MVQWLNREHRAARGEDVDDLSSRIASYELAFRLQGAVREAVDLGAESRATRRTQDRGGPWVRMPLRTVPAPVSMGILTHDLRLALARDLL